MDTPWTRARKSRSEIQEDRLGKMPEGQRQVNSGRFWRWARDGIVWNFLFEARTTEKESYTIQRKEFLQMRTQAFQTPPGLKAGMQIEIQDLNLTVIETSDFQSMYTRLVELEARYESETT